MQSKLNLYNDRHSQILLGALDTNFKMIVTLEQKYRMTGEAESLDRCTIELDYEASTTSSERLIEWEKDGQPCKNWNLYTADTRQTPVLYYRQA